MSAGDFGNGKIFIEHKAIKLVLVVAFFLILSMPGMAAKQGAIKLLAVSDGVSGELIGSVADMYLEVKPGNGGVYIDTFPLTRLDTQISTRFAAEYACRQTETDCDEYDFFYTIKAGSTIVGGPSAGSATTVLTMAVLLGLDIDPDVAITGTINSGGLVGPVGGVREKIEAASANGITTVLIPSSEKYLEEDNATNETVDIETFATEHNITVIEIDDVQDALYRFTGTRLEEPDNDVVVDTEYTKIMGHLADELCTHTLEMQKAMGGTNLTLYNISNDMIDGLQNTTLKAYSHLRDGNYYSAASLCFGANTKYSYLQLKILNLTDDELRGKYKQQKTRLSEMSIKIENQNYTTVSQIETYIIVKERLLEAEDLLKSYVADMENNLTDMAIFHLAYAEERINSAESWSNFFHLKTKEVTINRESLKNSCTQKIAEAEERYQYVSMLVPDLLGDTRQELNRAYSDMNSSAYALCLFKASKAKAEADMVLSVYGVDPSKVQEVVEKKLPAVRKNIVSQQSKGFFPILGYSYYEYATTLLEADPFSSLLYSEYSLELSNLDLYFKEPKKTSFFNRINWQGLTYFWIFVLGFGAGSVLTIKLHEKKIRSVLQKQSANQYKKRK